MASRKRNEFLDIEESDAEESDHGYDSEAAEESKTRASKRRKVLDHDDRFSNLEEEEDEDEDENGDRQDHEVRVKEKPVKPLIKPPKKNKTGVVYLSSLPPYLKPSALKSLLLQRNFGPISRIFLSPAVPSTSGSGKRNNRRKTYSDGWVEFESKKTAKLCAETLNANIIGGRKGGWYHDDIWNIKYLKGYRWSDLMEQINNERSTREAQRRIEEMRARKEDKVFLSGVEKGKVVEGIRRKREQKKAPAAKSGDSDGDVAPEDLQIRRVFRQNEVKQRKEDQDPDSIGEETRRVLGKIF